MILKMMKAMTAVKAPDSGNAENLHADKLDAAHAVVFKNRALYKTPVKTVPSIPQAQ